MRRIILMAGLGVLTFGCAPAQPSFQGSVKVNRSNGRVQTVEVRFPGAQHATNIHSKAQANDAIEQMEKTLKDLKAARDEWEE